MKRIELILVMLITAWIPVRPLPAKEPCCHWLGCRVPDCIGKWCCDDYDTKCLPCVDVRFCSGCDDYCGKRIPCTCVLLCPRCDDYRKKCLPRTCTPPLLHNLHCGAPPNRRCAVCSQRKIRVSTDSRCVGILADVTEQANETESLELQSHDATPPPPYTPSAPFHTSTENRFVVVREVSHEATCDDELQEIEDSSDSASSDSTSAAKQQQAASLRSFLQSLRR